MHDRPRFFGRPIWLAMFCLTTLGVGKLHAEELAPATPAPGANGAISLNPMQESAQAFRNIVKAIGPEAAMDMMFSSIDPVCRNALLSKTTDKSNAPTRAAEMRDNKFLQPAIAVGEQITQWVKGNPDQRGHPPLPNWMDPKNYWGWARLDKPAGESAQKTAPAMLVTPPKRY